jgi:putative SOS response-associated peptidase YedK
VEARPALHHSGVELHGAELGEREEPVVAVPARRRRADGTPWGLAGLWATWTDKATGEVHESYTMLTLNADEHPLMNRMHKPDPKLPPDQQDKRSVIPIEFGDVDLWLAGTMDEAKQLLRLPAVELFEAGPAAV